MMGEGRRGGGGGGGSDGGGGEDEVKVRKIGKGERFDLMEEGRYIDKVIVE